MCRPQVLEALLQHGLVGSIEHALDVALAVCIQVMPCLLADSDLDMLSRTVSSMPAFELNSSDHLCDCELFWPYQSKLLLQEDGLADRYMHEAWTMLSWDLIDAMQSIMSWHANLGE